jgi:EmrB/QacA subfamily drug resistance transporter
MPSPGPATTSTQARQPRDATSPRAVATTLLVSVAYFMVTLDALVVMTALPSVRADLGGSPADLQWTVNAYNLTFAAGIVAAATVADRLGRRRVFRLGLVVFVLASAACALAPGAGALIAFRALQGVGAAIITPVGLTLLTAAVPAERRGAAVGIWGGIAGLGVAAGPLIGGAVTEGLDWHWVFWVNVPIGLLAFLAAGRVLVESVGPRGALDLRGMVLATTGVGAVIWGLVRGPELGWSSSAVALSLVVGGLLVAAFLGHESRTAAPMMPLRFFRSRTFAAAVAAGFLMTAAIFSAAYLTTGFFQLGHGESPLGTGLRFLPWTATPLLVAPLAGRLSDRYGARVLAVPGLAAQAIGFVWFAHLAATGAGFGSYVVPFVLAGVGVSLALPTLPTAGLGAVPRADVGRASGVVNTMQRLGAATGVAVVTVAFDAHGSLADPAAVTSGYHAAILTSAVLSALAAVIALGAGGRRPSAPDRAAAPAVVECGGRCDVLSRVSDPEAVIPSSGSSDCSG